MSDRLHEHHRSPSLLGGPAADDAALSSQAFELKFLLAAETAGAVAAWALGPGGLHPDPHGDPALGGRYTTTTLYLDTPDLDVYHRREGYARRRFRLRRYGDDAVVHLERKTRDGDLVQKQRCELPIEQASLLGTPAAADNWEGRWFHTRIGELGLLPASVVTYQRAAFFGVCAEGPLRVTIDRDARARLCASPAEWTPARLGNHDGADVLRDRAVVELKYLTALPLPFKTLMKNLTLHPSGVSKYRLGREALGSPAPIGSRTAGPSLESPLA